MTASETEVEPYTFTPCFDIVQENILVLLRRYHKDLLSNIPVLDAIFKGLTEVAQDRLIRSANSKESESIIQFIGEYETLLKIWMPKLLKDIEDYIYMIEGLWGSLDAKEASFFLTTCKQAKTTVSQSEYFLMEKPFLVSEVNELGWSWVQVCPISPQSVLSVTISNTSGQCGHVVTQIPGFDKLIITVSFSKAMQGSIDVFLSLFTATIIDKKSGEPLEINSESFEKSFLQHINSAIFIWQESSYDWIESVYELQLFFCGAMIFNSDVHILSKTGIQKDNPEPIKTCKFCDSKP